MSTHLSRSERTILALQQRVAELEQMQREYNAFLNYVVYWHGNGTDFTLNVDKMKSITCYPIKSEIIDNGKQMKLSRVETNNNKPIIVLPE